MTPITAPGRAPFAGLPRPLARIARWFVADPFLLYTATLVPVVLAVALAAARRNEVAIAVVISVVAVGLQAAAGRLMPGRLRRRPRLASLVRLAIPLAYVGIAVQLIGGPALPLLALYVPVVAGAAALGAFQGWITAAIAAAIYLTPELAALASPAEVVLRGITLAGVVLVLAFGTRRIVRALERAVRDARAAAALERRRRRQIEALETVGRVLAAGGPSDEVIDRVTDVVAHRFGYAQCSVYLGDDRRVELVAQRGYTDPATTFDSASGVAGRVMRTRQLAFVPDVSTDPDYLPGPHPVTSLICAPLILDGRFLGIFSVESSGTSLDATDRSLVAIMATRIGTAVALGQDRQALAARADLFRDIDRFARDVSASLAIDPLARHIAEAVGRVVPADTVVVTLLDREEGRYRVRAVRGLPEETVGGDVRPGEGLAGRAIRDRAVVVDGGSSIAAQPEAAHGIGLPLVRDGVVVGALTVGRTSDRGAFTDLEVEGLSLVAAHASLAIANAFLHDEVGQLAVRDPLTGLYNRRHFDEALGRLIAGRRRDRLSGWRPLSAVVFDLDHFGAFNKEHGHQVGDAVLKTFAEVLRSRFRASDLVARLGGEEFIAVLDGTDREQAAVIAEEVRATLGQRTIAVGDGVEVHVTTSAGCAELDPAEPTRESLLRTADVALFMAKRAGRDRVVAA